MIIYKITNKINEKSYIGQTVGDLNKRKCSHLCCVKNDKNDKNNIYLYNSMRKYGVDSFKWEILEECDTKEELDEMEFHYIKQYNTLKPSGYNMTLGGSTGAYGWKPTKENKENIGNGVKNFWKNVSDEYRENWGKLKSSQNSGKNNPMYGKKRPEICGENNQAKRQEVREKISNKRKGKRVSEEVKERIRQKLKGRKFTENQKENHRLALKNSDKVGRFERTKETREKLRKSKCVFEYDVISPDGNHFIIYSLKKFAKENGLNKSSLRYHIKNNTDNYKGWIIRIKGEYTRATP